MSYDMDIGDEEFNYTYNVAPIWYFVFPEEGIRKHYNKTGSEAVPILLELYSGMIENKEELIKLDPENGWGDYYGALNFVHHLITASLRNPDKVWTGD